MRLLGAALRRLRAEDGGAVAVEFAMVAVPFLGLIGAIFETGLVYFRSQQLQLATESASRAVLTKTAADMTYREFIDTHVCTWQHSGTVSPGTLPRAFDCSKLIVDIASPASWASASATGAFYTTPPSPDSMITMPDNDRVAIVRIAYPLPTTAAVLTGGVLRGLTVGRSTSGSTSINGVWTHMLVGAYAFKVEPK